MEHCKDFVDNFEGISLPIQLENLVNVEEFEQLTADMARIEFRDADGISPIQLCEQRLDGVEKRSQFIRAFHGVEAPGKLESNARNGPEQLYRCVHKAIVMAGFVLEGEFSSQFALLLKSF